MPICIKRTPLILRPDPSRVLLRPFSPGDSERAGRIIDRILAIPEECVAPLLAEIRGEFCKRHQNIHDVFLERFEQVRETLRSDQDLSEERRQLIGSYFLAIFAGSRGVVQSVYRSTSRSNGSRGRRSAVRPQPACHRGGAHFFCYISNRDTACR